jgi:hypothetical protein
MAKARVSDSRTRNSRRGAMNAITSMTTAAA